MNPANPISEGVQELIDRLHEEGARPGREEGQKILADAKREAARILDEAKEEARDILNKAHLHVEAEKKSAGEALRVAVRDTVLDLKEQLQTTFEHHVGKLVESKLQEQAFLEQMILLIAKEAFREHEASDVTLLIGTKGLEKEAAEQFVASVTRTMLKNGIQITKFDGRGIRIILEAEALTVDLSEKVLASLIQRMIVPRYRAIFEGVGS